MRFEGKRVVLTGGASGIGRATVEAFIAEGALVMMGDINAEAGAAMAAEARFDQRLFFQKTDVIEEADIRGLLDNAAQQFGGIDILFNNAGAGGPRKRIDEISVDEWDFVQNLLLRSVMLGIRHVVPHMRAAGGGAIVNTASIAGHQAGWGPIAYSVAKCGVRHLSRLAAPALSSRIYLLTRSGITKRKPASWIRRSGRWRLLPSPLRARADPKTSPRLCCIWHRIAAGLSRALTYWSTVA
jgi:NAD(P)-dependent dehydrogenase (short-subunit alcohol dehydrogenase family)